MKPQETPNDDLIGWLKWPVRPDRLGLFVGSFTMRILTIVALGAFVLACLSIGLMIWTPLLLAVIAYWTR